MTLVMQPGPLLKERTTLRLGGRALAEVTVSSEQELDLLPETLVRLGGSPFVLGRGSNVLARDGELPVVLVRPLMRGPGPSPWELVAEERDMVVVRMGAGVPLPGLVRAFAEKGWAGLEGMAGIPGSFGGAVAMNAGSFGSETAKCLTRVRVYSPHGGARWLGPESFETGYRTFRLKAPEEGMVIVAAELRLAKERPEEVLERMRASLGRKKATQPVKAWSAGSAFKNPGGPGSGMSAGRLLEDAGMKGFVLGGMAFSEMHANFLVNQGRGTAQQAFELLDLARERVLALSGHRLEMEVRICPCS